VVTVTPFSGTTTPDKNQVPSIMLQCIAGKMPNRNVLAGTLGERLGIEVGKTYLMQVRERGYDQVFGRDFQWIKVDELHGVDILNACNVLGPPEIIVIPRPAGFEDAYQRKGNAVESQTTKRIQEGLYIPVIQRDYSHKTAAEVKLGTTIQDATDDQNLTPEDLDKGAKLGKM